MSRKADIVTSDEGSIWRFVAATRKGWNWLLDNCEGAYDSQVICEHRYGFDIACGALRDGLRLQDADTRRFARLPDSAA